MAGKEQTPKRADELSARDKILAAAEEMFAEGGYDGTSLRQIAAKAGVPITLISYHFSSKLGLYRTVFERRSPVIVSDRRAGLALAELEPDPDRRLEMIIQSFLLPLLSLRRDKSRKSVGTLLVREVADPKADERGIVESLMDPVAKAVMASLHRVLPDRSDVEIVWAYEVLVGVMMFVLSDSGRLARLSGGAINPDDLEDTMGHIVPLLLDGIRGAHSRKRAPKA